MLTKQIPLHLISSKEAWHPIDECISELSELIEEAKQRNYSFEEEVEWVRSLRFDISEHPEESVAEFNELYAQVQAHHSRVSSILISILREKAIWQKFFLRAKRLYRKARGRLLSGREDIKALKNRDLQEAKVNEEVSELVDVMELLEGVVEDLDLLIDIVQVKKDELDKANTNLARQQKVVESLIGLGHPVNAQREDV